MPESQALVSVIIPAFNGEKTILDTLSSVAEQKHRPIQLIVIDDASSDSTGSLVDGFLKGQPSLQESLIIHHAENQGLSKTLNDGVRKSSGEYLLILHQDCRLLSPDWIDKALTLMSNDQIAVVTGYYGIPDTQREDFAMRAFGVLRRQFHSPPDASCEETTFSEGKCDLYRKNVLQQIGGFPQSFRIAGEDLVVSYKLRREGYKIIKSYELPVQQRFTGSAESILGNFKKEFTFGKAMGGVFSQFRFFVFRGFEVSNYSRSRSLNRASQPVFVIAVVIFGILTFLLSTSFAYVVSALFLVKYLYYVLRLNAELKHYPGQLNHPLLEAIAAGLLGIISDFMYSLGFGYGLIRRSLGMSL